MRISTLIRTKPFNASERLVKFTEFVLSNGGMKELLVEGRKIPFMKYHNLDIFVPLGAINISTSYILSSLMDINYLSTNDLRILVQADRLYPSNGKEFVDINHLQCHLAADDVPYSS
ncbi:hypothetical protein ANCCAN_18604 [Ancylostoma caninum]|uniref:Uncharacterized protein n=1 Tax=Ancylostoma caninum TaxID=29170 RepID=A0A368FTG8_ANCCA|nr:hypothetical protein ANCCAN_18604 [Ancylostoma caninum]